MCGRITSICVILWYTAYFSLLCCIQEQENQSLREQLEEYQRREREEAEKLAETIASAPEETGATDVEGMPFIYLAFSW